jgi:acyl-CoA synthetase (AMP-forming)/AMP-acid ligase II
MALLGNLIKGEIDLAGTVHLSEKTASEDQYLALINLLESAQDTSFGKFYGFDKVLASDKVARAFSESVPIYTYDSMNERWWKQQQLVSDITWPSKPSFFALSSGTTGKKSKRIPITNQMIQDSRSVGVKLIKDLNNFDISP